jgi:ribosome-binding protein aMBF1 (putative translation factor)
MSRTLIGLMAKKIEREGPAAKLKLALSVGRTEQMIDRYLKGQTIPRPEVARTLAKECGANDRVAQQVEEESYATRSKAMKAG